MKKLIILELVILFLATTFQSDNPPGWYQQTLPVNDFVNDIFFLDSLNGWAVTPNGHIMNTQNGGDNWSVQKDSAGNLFTVQFLDVETGFASGRGNHGIIYKTTNSGDNWNLIFNFNPVGIIDDMSFVNKDTGWVCSQDAFDGGVFKTTNGGISWLQQLNYGIDNPDRIFFINQDTGWTSNGGRDKLYKTINGGLNWNLQYTHVSQINDIYFFDGNIGILTGGTNYISIDGGFTWGKSVGNVGGIRISMGTDSVGWAGSNLNTVRKTIDGGISWGWQITNASNPSVSAYQNLTAWVGGNRLMHTTDGGGPLLNIHQISTEIPDEFMLYQNYPNPFNPKTIIKYQLISHGKVILKIFDIQGKEVAELVNENQGSGTYQFTFDGSGLTSGVYLYRIEAKTNSGNFLKTRRMFLLK